MRLRVFCEAISVAIGCVPSIHGAIEFDCGKFKPVILIGIFLAFKSDIVRYSLTKYNSIKKKRPLHYCPLNDKQTFSAWTWIKYKEYTAAAKNIYQGAGQTNLPGEQPAD